MGGPHESAAASAKILTDRFVRLRQKIELYDSILILPMQSNEPEALLADPSRRKVAPGRCDLPSLRVHATWAWIRL